MRRLLLAALLGGLGGCMGGAPPPIPLNPIRFLLINDVYVADTMVDGRGGLARVATVRNRLDDQGPILFVLAGDVLSPSLLSKYYGGAQMVDVLNAAKLDYATLGNHEFDLELPTLVARIAQSKFKWISSNCTLANGAPLPKVLPWDTVRVSGHKVGLFGLTLQGSYPVSYRCSDPDSAAHRVVERLSAEGADLIVGITHQTVQADRDLLAREPRIELILGGHEHEALDSTVSGRHVVKADANARTAQFATLWGGKDNWRQALGLVQIDGGIPPDSTVSEVVAGWQDSLQRRIGPARSVASTEVRLDPARSLSRRGASLLGDLVAEAIRTGTQSDVALVNSGALRLDEVIRPGPVTNYQIEALFPFPDHSRVVTFPLTGARLRQVIEHSVSERVFGTGGFLQVSGLSFTFDRARPSGKRVVGPLQRAGGGTLEAGDSVLVSFGAYSACRGGDGYRVPEAAPACSRKDSAPRAVDLFMRYITDSLGGRIQAPKDSPALGAGPNHPG